MESTATLNLLNKAPDFSCPGNRLELTIFYDISWQELYTTTATALLVYCTRAISKHPAGMKPTIGKDYASALQSAPTQLPTP